MLLERQETLTCWLWTGIYLLLDIKCVLKCVLGCKIIDKVPERQEQTYFDYLKVQSCKLYKSKYISASILKFPHS